MVETFTTSQETTMHLHEDTSTYRLYWRSADAQGEYAMGEYATEDDALAARKNAVAELLNGCRDDEQREGILDGTLVTLAPYDARSRRDPAHLFATIPDDDAVDDEEADNDR